MRTQKFASTRERGSRNGFTLMEVIVAVIIVGMTSVATLSAFATELRTAEKSRYALEAASLAQNRIAMLELVPPEDVIALPDSSQAGHFDPPFEHYAWTGALTPVINESDLFDATVQVTWDNGSYTLATRMYRPAALVNSK